MDPSPIDRADVKAWLQSSITRYVFALLLDHFSHQRWLLGAELGSSLDRYKGRAEVLNYLEHPGDVLSLVPEHRDKEVK